ncbi:hypothetical protein BH23ACT9_BH23ACT9_39470 [soil metagenome]
MSGTVDHALLDTSVVIALHEEDLRLPSQADISAITFAELAYGPLATDDPDERAARADRLARTAATFDPLPFDTDCARAYARIADAVRRSGRTHRSRMADLQIAATAMAHDLPLFTRNAVDLTGLEHLVDVIDV